MQEWLLKWVAAGLLEDGARAAAALPCRETTDASSNQALSCTLVTRGHLLPYLSRDVGSCEYVSGAEEPECEPFGRTRCPNGPCLCPITAPALRDRPLLRFIDRRPIMWGQSANPVSRREAMLSRCDERDDPRSI
ncbi:hypothetical protein B0J12DRAFT_241791 [Macrophomina phaseolina]|uniref:Uncharacterized protein n=1 Tax=Macrophomina phaseolina TaxID=35725 RepID=A0ABQ8GR08_9PEZI|nr:hypothetical protein B0J12DRAFT_241791 [Macrophomina phaseolina]